MLSTRTRCLVLTLRRGVNDSWGRDKGRGRGRGVREEEEEGERGSMLRGGVAQ